MSRWVGFFLGPSKWACESYFSNPIKPIDIMCNNYLDDQIISKLHQTNLVKKILDIEVINKFIKNMKKK